MGRMILFRSEVRRKKLELFNKPSKLTKEGVDSMKEEVKRCKEWEVAIQGWRVALEEEGGREEERLEREAQVMAEDTMPLEAGLTGALTCPHCRLACSKASNLKRHRWVAVFCLEK